MINKDNLCIECGICSAICPKGCISTEKKGYNYLPNINNGCVGCGLCKKVCPMNNLCDNYDHNKNIEKAILGEYKKIISAKVLDKILLNCSASGGIVTKIVKYLLDNNEYDKAFLIEGYDYIEQLKTIPFDKNSDLSKTPKSRYLTISHKPTCEYMKNNPNERLIIVGTGCAINGIRNFIQIKNLNMDNYLFLGLICDKTMHYGVYEYFKGYIRNNIKNFFFKTKENGGWPGHMRFKCDNGEIIDLDRKERINVKEYFMPECCLYCLNKLNSNADIVLGDNYIKKYEDKEGKSVVLIRTDTGDEIINKIKPEIEIIETTEEDFLNSLNLKNRERNIEYAKIKGLLNEKPKSKYKKKYKKSIKKIKIGHSENIYKNVQKDLKINNIISILKKLPKYFFSTKNIYLGNVKYKQLYILGIKITFKPKTLGAVERERERANLYT